MSYLVRYAARRPVLVPQPPRRGTRVDERTPLNRPGFYGDAYVRVFVEDTSGRRRWRGTPPTPRIKLRIADCVNVINLEFCLDSHACRENSLLKIETLLGALHRFREALVAEADLYERREHALRR